MLKSIVQEGAERLHVLGKVLIQSAGNGTNGCENDIGNTRLGTDSRQNAEQNLHDAVGLRLDLDFESLNDSLGSKLVMIMEILESDRKHLPE
jgi:hypothetical protein